jgi:hypothetical protein
MVHCHRFLLIQFLWTVLLAGHASRLPAQEQAIGSVSEGNQSQARTAEVVSLPEITGKTSPTTELQAPGLEHLLNHLEAFRKAHTPFHIRHREVIKVRTASEIKAIESMDLPPGMLLNTEYESAFWDNRSWRRCLSRGVDGEQASDKRSRGDCEGTAGLDVPFALLGVFIEPKPENCKLTFDDIFPHITITADEHSDRAELWMFPVSGQWIPKRVRGTPEDREEPVLEWEVNHVQSFGKDRPPQIVDGEVRFTVRDGDQETTITSEFFITKALYGDDVVPREIDASLAPMPDPAVAATEPAQEQQQGIPDAQEKVLTPIAPTLEAAPDNAAPGDKSITDPTGDHSTSNSTPLAVKILDGREDREFLSHLEPLKAEGIIAVSDDPTATGDIILIIDGPPLTDSKQFQDLLRGISQLRLPSCLVYVRPQPRTDPRQESVVQISTRPDVSFADVARVVDLVKSEPGIAFLLRQPEAVLPQTKTEELRVLALKHVRASEAARIVEHLYNKGLSVAVAERTNSLVVRGTRPVVEEVETLLLRLDTQEPVTEPASAASATGGDGTGLRVNVPALGPEPLAVDFSVPVRGDGQTFTFFIGFNGQSADDLQRQYEALEQRARTLSDELRKPLTDTGKGQELKSQIRDAVKQAFEARQKLQKAELAEFAQRLQGIQESIELRDKVSQQIIDRRVEELLDPNLKWDNPETSSSGRAPALRSASRDSSLGAESHFGARSAVTSDDTRTVQFKFDSSKLGKVEWHSGPGGVMVDGIGAGRINAKPGERLHMRLSEIPGRENAIVFLSLEVSHDPANEMRRKGVVNPSEVLSYNAIPLEVTSDDLDQAISGNLVTKVIYLPHDRKSTGLFETLVSTRLDPGIDTSKAAREKGRVVAIVRISIHLSSDTVENGAASTLTSPVDGSHSAAELPAVDSKFASQEESKAAVPKLSEFEPGYKPKSLAETAIAKLVLVFFQDRSRRAVPCLVVKINKEYFAVTTGPATVVPDGTPHAIDRSVVEWSDGSQMTVTYDERSTKELQLYRFADDAVIPEPQRSAAEIVIDAIPTVGLDKSLEVGVPLSALTAVRAGSLSETRVRVSAVNVSQKLTLPSHKVEHQYDGLFSVDAALPEGTPVFLDGKLVGLTILGSRFVGEEARQSYVFPANRLWEFCNKVP